MDAITLVDTVLDRSVVLGYGNTGFEIRRRLPGWPAGPTRMDGKSVLVTGAASGIGLAAAAGFADLGASVWALARDDERASQAVRLIRARARSGARRPGPRSDPAAVIRQAARSRCRGCSGRSPRRSS